MFLLLFYNSVNFVSSDETNSNVLEVTCNQFAEIFEGNILAPYKFKNVSF